VAILTEGVKTISSHRSGPWLDNYAADWNLHEMVRYGKLAQQIYRVTDE